MEGTRIATVGVATFAVSLFAALWIIMCLVGRLTRQHWMYPTGGAMLAIVVIIFAVAPREPTVKSNNEADAGAAIVYSSYYPSMAIVAAILILSMVASCVAFAVFELPVTRRAKRIEVN